MKYQIAPFILDTQARTLSDKNSCQQIRPKTLALLLYVIDRAGQIISKQELLDRVWDDVNVDDGVVFQSVREIRQLFSNPNILQNHPRKGYEFTAQVRPVSEDNKQRAAMLSVLKYFLPAAVLLLVLWQLLPPDSNETLDVHYGQSIVVLPVKSRVPYAQNEWIYLGAMEQLIAKLQGLPSSVFVYQGTYIPRLMHIAGLDREFNSGDVNKVFTVSGATLIVETEIHGNVYDYKLVYKFHLANDIKQGVILDTSINGALASLAKKVAAFINHPLQSSENVPMKEFSDALFAEAMISYESDWQTSISFFESYLALNPDSVIALIYLSKLYLWNDRAEQASELIKKAAKLNGEDLQQAAHIDLIKGRIAANQKNWPQAMPFYQQAAQQLEQHSSHSKQSDWFLKASIAQAQGLAYLEQNLLSQSAQAFNLALSFYQITQSQIGINSTLLHLANVLYQQGNIEQGMNTYLQAKQNIERIKLDFLYSMLAEYEKKFANYHVGAAG
ncbi:winged helix-turn-helix domain-containing protein [Thalassotalea sp. ND16A]|uniref:winged helix-turn-helix domain-containing protein n=1 Tax=Thalassotalea sp. ND16A TaxID=1535422 RepID=UPI00051A7D22|nr:winged helix-turn-helix domain-containing protein [Thalassotalea sp. ND16A]KGJ98096.1 putative transcriptional regulator, CadC [Thalassotalea sp. ND16A]